MLILTAQGRHSLQRKECVCKEGVGGRGRGGGEWVGGGVEGGEWVGGGWRGVAKARSKCIGESYLGVHQVNTRVEKGQLIGKKLHNEVMLRKKCAYLHSSQLG